MNSFAENLRHAFVNSEYRMVVTYRDTDPHAQQLRGEYDQLFTTIRKKLGEPDGDLMLRLEEKLNEIGCHEDDLIYQQGMIDCVTLLKTIRLL